MNTIGGSGVRAAALRIVLLGVMTMAVAGTSQAQRGGHGGGAWGGGRAGFQSPRRVGGYTVYRTPIARSGYGPRRYYGGHPYYGRRYYGGPSFRFGLGLGFGAPYPVYHPYPVYIAPAPPRVVDVTVLANVPPAGTEYYDPYCDRTFPTRDGYQQHLDTVDHDMVIEVVDRDSGQRLRTFEFLQSGWTLRGELDRTE